MQVEERPPPPLCKNAPHAPAILERICNRCLGKEPKARYTDAGALADALQSCWRQRIQSRRFARLTGWAAGTLMFLLGCQLLAFHWLASSREMIPEIGETLSNRFGPMTADALMALGHIFGWLLIIIAPVFVLLATLTWLSAWVWHRGRVVLFLVGFWLFTLLAWAGYQFLEPTAWAGAALYLAMVLTIAAATATLVRAGRPVTRTRFSESSSGGTEPFLQRLFAVRSRVQLTTDVRPGNLARVGLEDFEIGKVLHKWPEGQVCRARQKSLDRPVLVWINEPGVQSGKPPGDISFSRDPTGSAAVPISYPSSPPLLGTVVRHPDVLALHAVGVGKEGRFLVTEPAAAVPMPEWLLRRELQPSEAGALAIRLARILQSFHEQGVVHGRLGAEWILIRGELEPLLCPCGMSSQSIQGRQRDLMALGKLLREWLPPHPLRWQRRALADVYRVADAACEGKYVRAKSLAEDLERAALRARINWRILWGNALVIALALLPVLAWAAEQMASPEESWLDSHLLLALSPSAVLLGYTFSRGRIQSRRLRLRHVEDRGSRIENRGGRASSIFNLRSSIWRGALQVALLVIPVGMLVWLGHRQTPGRQLNPGVGLIAGASMLGFWFVGVLIAGMVSAAELIHRSLQVAGSEGERGG